ncbi:MAG: pyridoxamine 5'-phosphate oxidase family protein [Campylobacteraceae bacterium]|jgi:uncharacterized protein YhbP (UPF0306 family)|nr:pyridoxamine 5'-phosphate oxidase family protein [Campylobacteraceae bacterium]
MSEEFIWFIKEHHVLHISSHEDGKTWSANCFYVFLKTNNAFVFASDKDTRHMRNIIKTPYVSGTIALETKEIGLIQGLQFEGIVQKASLKAKKAYFLSYPFAAALAPSLWELEIDYAKLTDNRLGFGKKLEFKR